MCKENTLTILLVWKLYDAFHTRSMHNILQWRQHEFVIQMSLFKSVTILFRIWKMRQINDEFSCHYINYTLYATSTNACLLTTNIKMNKFSSYLLIRFMYLLLVSYLEHTISIKGRAKNILLHPTP